MLGPVRRLQRINRTRLSKQTKLSFKSTLDETSEATSFVSSAVTKSTDDSQALCHIEQKTRIQCQPRYELMATDLSKRFLALRTRLDVLANLQVLDQVAPGAEADFASHH